MSRYSIVAAAFTAMLPLLVGSASIANESTATVQAEAMPLELSGQTRLRIYPRRRGELLPGDSYYYPGLRGVRVCQSWLQRELRVSGPVVTPQMRCRWVPG